ncbi:MAG: hypothetical protein ACTSQE_13545 [Candidatus Heimdallarchaeaceae archaeon]
MKFLIQLVPKIQTSIPENYKELLLKSNDWVNSKLDDGTFDCAYYMIPAGGVCIANVDNHDKLWELINEYPVGFNFDWKITPLADYNTNFEKAIKLLQG